MAFSVWKQRYCLGSAIASILLLWSSEVAQTSELTVEDFQMRDALEAFRQQQQNLSRPLENEEAELEWRDREEAWSRFNPSVAPFVGRWHKDGIHRLTIYPSQIEGQACLLSDHSYGSEFTTIEFHRAIAVRDRLQIPGRDDFLMREQKFLGWFLPKSRPPNSSIAAIATYSAPEPVPDLSPWLQSLAENSNSEDLRDQTQTVLRDFEEADCVVRPPAFSTTPPSVPAFPQPLPAPREPQPDYDVMLQYAGGAPISKIGIGHLRPKKLDVNAELDSVRWLRGVTLPLYDLPNGKHWGWLANGWLIRNGESPIALGEERVPLKALWTYYSLYSLPILEARGQGWFLLRYSPGVGSQGTAWIHESHLNLGTIPVAIESWQDRFLEFGWVYFVNSTAETAHALRSEPNRESPVRAWVSDWSYIQPLEFRGDWMRVKVEQLNDGCDRVSPDATTEEGWMQWRSAGRDSWIWYPPKGC